MITIGQARLPIKIVCGELIRLHEIFSSSVTQHLSLTSARLTHGRIRWGYGIYFELNMTLDQMIFLAIIAKR